MSVLPVRTLTLAAHAKINLTLDILLRRPDGYHEIRSVIQEIGLHDRVEVSLVPDSREIHLTVDGPEMAGVPTDQANLVYRAAEAMLEKARRDGSACGVKVRLNKNIPAQAGLGGGSSDAAATQSALNKLLDLRMSPANLAELGAELGADVPFFLTGATAMVEGIGDRVTKLAPLPERPVVIVKPDAGVETASAYAAIDRIPNRRPGKSTNRFIEWRKSEESGLNDPPVGNDFETILADISPAAADIRSRFESLAAVCAPGAPILLCGSGAALFCLPADNEAAERLVSEARLVGLGQVWLTTTWSGDR